MLPQLRSHAQRGVIDTRSISGKTVAIPGIRSHCTTPGPMTCGPEQTDGPRYARRARLREPRLPAGASCPQATRRPTVVVARRAPSPRVRVKRSTIGGIASGTICWLWRDAIYLFLVRHDMLIAMRHNKLILMKHETRTLIGAPPGGQRRRPAATKRCKQLQLQHIERWHLDRLPRRNVG